jgi:hypothetical protein
MNTPRILALSVASLLTVTFAQAQTWDGGGNSDLIVNAFNWNPDGVPVLNADIIFAGNVRLTPENAGSFQVNSVTFNNTAGAFVIGGTGTLSIKGGGLTSNDTSTQTFNNPVSFGLAATSTINATSGALVFNGAVTTATTTLTLNGGNAITLGSSIAGNGAITKAGAGAFNFAATASPIGADFNLNAGVTTLTAGSTQAFTSGSSIGVSGTASLVFNESVILAGAQLTRAEDAELTVGAGKTLTVQNGGDVVITGSFSSSTASTILVTGAGSTFSSSSSLVFNGGSVVGVSLGGRLSSFYRPFIGNGGNGTVTVDGVGSDFSAPGLDLASGGGTGSLTFSNGSTGSLGGVSIAVSYGVGTSGTLNIQSTAVVDATSLSIATEAVANTGTMTITGAILVVNGAGGTTIGAGSASTGTLNVQSGGFFQSGTGTTIVNATGTIAITGGTFNQNGNMTVSGRLTRDAAGAFNLAAGKTLTVQNGGNVVITGSFSSYTGTINIDGGTVNFAGPLIRNGCVFNFNTGALSIVDAFTVGTGGLLGTNVTFDTTRQFATSGTTTIEAFHTLTLNGGGFSTGALINNGTLAFNSGTLAITGVPGLNIGTGGLGSIVTLGSGSNLQVANIATVASGASLTLNGGTFSAGLLVNSGTVRVNLGTGAVLGVNNNSGGRVFVGDTLVASGSWTNAAGATLTLENNGLVNGLGALSNSGLVTGTGSIATPFTNASGGEVRGELGKTLTFTGASGSNAGRINLLGGTVQFTQPLTNGATGQINGAGVVAFPTTPVPSSGSAVAGLNNSGRLNFSGGDTQVYGTVQMLAGSHLIASGGAAATFYDVFRHNGAEVKASAGSSLVFFGEVRGAGSFTGTGTIYMEGGYSPGNSPASVALSTDLVLGNAGTLTLELGGLIAGSSYDQLVLGAGGSLALGGTLLLDLINDFSPVAGDSFQVLDFTLGQLTGGFDEIRLADPLPAGLSFDTTQLTTTGRIGVVPEPGIAALLLTGGAFLGLRRRNRK